MDKVIDKVIVSLTSPRNKSVLWLDSITKEIKSFIGNTWVAISSSKDEETECECPKMEIVDNLPTTPEEDVLYFVKTQD